MDHKRAAAQVNFGGDNRGIQLGITHGDVNIQQASLSDKGIDGACISALRCPNAVAVKNRLKENKDRLLLHSIDWIVQDARFVDWKDGDDMGLLWIRGGAGKGKTMISIGLIEQLSRLPDATTSVVYFFCQHDNYEINTVESILKGLIRQLFEQRPEARETLRRHFDEREMRFIEDVTLFETLWSIWFELVECCPYNRIYVVIDALDECMSDGMKGLLRHIVRAGLGRHSKLKWLLTSRPIDDADQELLVGDDQEQISLEHESHHVAESVENWIVKRVGELNHRHRYGEQLRQQITTELTVKAEGVFLWVSLVCKRLEDAKRQDAMKIIEESPPGLPAFYQRMFDQLTEGDPELVYDCIRLLQTMLLVYRPLGMVEVSGVSGISDDVAYLNIIVDRCASFVGIRNAEVNFNHKSAPDFLLGTVGQSLLNADHKYGHSQLALTCMKHLSETLRVNIVNLRLPASTRADIDAVNNKEQLKLLDSTRYSAIFWVQHIEAASKTTEIQQELVDDGAVTIFLHTKLLEWIECLSLIDQLSNCLVMLRTLLDITKVSANMFITNLLDDAIRFVRRHYQTLEIWPLQVYSSGLCFSPQASVVRQANLSKLPKWLRRAPRAEDTWSALLQTLTGHNNDVATVAFSPDGKFIISGSDDRTIRIWNVTTGAMHKRPLEGHSEPVTAVDFSPDGELIVSGSDDTTIKTWNLKGELQKTLEGHTDEVYSVAVSPDGKRIVSGSRDETVKLWNMEGELQETLKGHSKTVSQVAFSPDGLHIASGSHDSTVNFWNVATGERKLSLTEFSQKIKAVTFSPEGMQIATGSDDQTIRLWDTETGELQQTFAGHEGAITSLSFSPNGMQLASGSDDTTVRLWDVRNGELQQTFSGHSSNIRSIAFSPDGMQIGSGSRDNTIKFWDVTFKGVRHRVATGHSDCVQPVSLHGSLIASGFCDKNIKLWDLRTGELQRTLSGHEGCVLSVAFSSDGSRIVSGSRDKTVRLWSTMTGELLRKIEANHKTWIRTVVFSQDDKYIASGSQHRAIKLWDTASGALVRVLDGHASAVTAIAFSPDGTQMVSGSQDNTIKVWDISKCLKGSKFRGVPVGRLLKFAAYGEARLSQPVTNLRFAADNQHLFTEFGVVDMKRVLANSPDPMTASDFQPSDLLSVSNSWIFLGKVPILRLLADLKVSCWDRQGDQLCIGFNNGLVLSFDFDRRSLYNEIGAAN